MMRWTILLLAVLALPATLATPRPASAAETIRIGGYLFPPFVELLDGLPGGLTLDMIAALNRAQSKYRFDFVPISAENRYADLARKKYDLIVFESASWGWNPAQIATTAPLMEGAELFVALAQPGRGQEFFSDLKSKRLAALRGNHYRFADMVTDPAILENRFDIALMEDPGDCLQAVLDGEVDVAVMTGAYLNRLLAEVPEFREALLIGQTPDQSYALSVIGAASRKPLVEEIGRLLRQTLESPDFQLLLQDYGQLRKG